MDAKLRKAQTTIFIILAILIAAGILIIFWARSGKIKQEEPNALSPEKYISKCARDVVEDTSKNILKGGGSINPQFYKLYENEKYNYLCYQKNFYLTCINQMPMIRKTTEQEIKKNTEDKIADCFYSVKQEYENKGYVVSEDNLDYNIEISPDKIEIKIHKKLTLKKGENSKSFENFNTYIPSNAEGLTSTAEEIVSQEAKFCNFDETGFMLLYNKYNIKKVSYDNSRLYEIKDKKTGEIFRLAVRSCAIPAGI